MPKERALKGRGLLPLFQGGKSRGLSQPGALRRADLRARCQRAQTAFILAAKPAVPIPHPSRMAFMGLLLSAVRLEPSLRTRHTR
jgi:hypothetical protein